MHDVLAVAITIATILAAAFFNQSAVNSLRGDLNGLRSEMNGLRSDMNGQFDAIKRDMREFYAEQARHDTRIGALERTAERR